MKEKKFKSNPYHPLLLPCLWPGRVPPPPNLSSQSAFNSLSTYVFPLPHLICRTVPSPYCSSSQAVPSFFKGDGGKVWLSPKPIANPLPYKPRGQHQFSTNSSMVISAKINPSLIVPSFKIPIALINLGAYIISFPHRLSNNYHPRKIFLYLTHPLSKQVVQQY